MKKIVVNILRDGSTTVDAQGFKGKGCTDATQAIELAIGGADPSNKQQDRKPDFFAEHSSTGTIRN